MSPSKVEEGQTSMDDNYKSIKPTDIKTFYTNIPDGEKMVLRVSCDGSTKRYSIPTTPQISKMLIRVGKEKDYILFFAYVESDDNHIDWIKIFPNKK